MFVKVFDNYHAGASLLTEAEQDAFYGALMRYAFEGVEPDLTGGAAVIWATVRGFIDESLDGQRSGSRGGDGRGNRKAKNPSENPPVKGGAKTPSENPHGKGEGKRPPENQKKRKEGNGKEKPEVFFSNSPVEDGAAAAMAEPPSPGASSMPVCPLCESPVAFDAKEGRWRCGVCGEVKEPAYREVEKS